MLMPMLAVEARKLFRGKLFWGSLFVMVVIAITVFFFMFTTRSSLAISPEDRITITASVIWPEALYGALLMVAQLGSLILVALAGAVVAQEYGWRTVSLWLSHGVPRPTLLIARFAVLALAVLISTLVLFLAVGALSAIFTVIIQGELDPSVVNFGEAALGILRTTFVLLPYLALTFLFAVITRSMVGAIGSGALFLMIIEPVMLEILKALGGVFAWARIFTPDFLATSVFNLNEAIARTPLLSIPEDVPELLAPGPAAALIALYTLILLALSIWLFRRQDLST